MLLRYRTLHGIVIAVVLAAASACTVSAAGTSPQAPAATTPGRTQGVTADGIRLGVASTDPKQLKALGIPADGPAAADLFQSWITAQNAAGGINGRAITLAFRPFLPTGPAEAQAACVELTEDKKVFAAIGILTGDTPLCFTETHQTAYIGLWGQSAARDKRSAAPFLAVEMADDRQRAAAVAALLDKGLLAGKKVALYWGAKDADVTRNVVEPALTAAGVTPVVKAGLDDFGTDQAAADQALDTIVAKFKAAGADVVLNASDFSPLMVALQRAAWLPPSILSLSAQGLSPTVMLATGIAPATMRNLTIAAPYQPTKAELAADPEVGRCVSEFNASGAAPQIDLAAVSRDQLQSVANACAAFRLFVAAAGKAGKDLTTASFGSAAEALGRMTLPGVPLGSLGPGKHSVGDAVGIYTFDAASNQMVPTGPAIPAPQK